MFAVARTDPNHERLSELLEVWGECFGGEPKAARDAIKRSDATQRLKAILLEIAGKNGEIDATKLGYWLKRNEGKVISGKRFERDDAKSPVAKYAARILPNFQTDEQTPKTPTTPSDEIEQSTRGYRTTRGSKPEREKVSAISSSWGEIE